jgi:hypothetical protein
VRLLSYAGAMGDGLMASGMWRERRYLWPRKGLAATDEDGGGDGGDGGQPSQDWFGPESQPPSLGPTLEQIPVRPPDEDNQTVPPAPPPQDWGGQFDLPWGPGRAAYIHADVAHKGVGERWRRRKFTVGGQSPAGGTIGLGATLGPGARTRGG